MGKGSQQRNQIHLPSTPRSGCNCSHFTDEKFEALGVRHLTWQWMDGPIEMTCPDRWQSSRDSAPDGRTDSSLWARIDRTIFCGLASHGLGEKLRLISSEKEGSGRGTGAGGELQIKGSTVGFWARGGVGI